jgi:hypothetical protein
MIPKAKKSGGPKSRSGKKVVSQNATKTGVYARSIVLPNEDKSAYQQLVNRYMNEFKPSDMAETTMVNNLANLTWKKMRLDHYEQNSLIAVWNGGVFLRDLEKEGSIRFPRDISWLEGYAVFDKFFKEGFDDLEKQYAEYEAEINLLYGQELNVHYLQRFFSQSPKLLEQIVSIAKSEFSRKNIQVTELLQITYANRDDQTLLDACTNKILERKTDIAWYQDNRDEIREAELQIKERRVMEKMQKTDFSRAHDELDRSFYRTLTELRKQQQWRREQNEVVVITSDQK